MQHFKYNCFIESYDSSDGFRHPLWEFRAIVTEPEILPEFSKKETSKCKYLRSHCLRAKSPSTTKLPIGTKFNNEFERKLPRIGCCMLVMLP
jgi:hypothetical protein